MNFISMTKDILKIVITLIYMKLLIYGITYQHFYNNDQFLNVE